MRVIPMLCPVDGFRPRPRSPRRSGSRSTSGSRSPSTRPTSRPAGSGARPCSGSAAPHSRPSSSRCPGTAMLGCRRHSGLGLDFDVDVDRLPQQFMRCDYPFPKNEANMRALVGTRLGHRAQRHADHGVVAVLWRCLFWHRAQRYVICDGMATFGFQGIVTQLIEAGIASSDAELTTLFSGENFDVHSYVETALREVPRPGPRQASGALSTPTLAAPTRRPADAERAGVGAMQLRWQEPVRPPTLVRVPHPLLITWMPTAAPRAVRSTSSD